MPFTCLFCHRDALDGSNLCGLHDRIPRVAVGTHHRWRMYEAAIVTIIALAVAYLIFVGPVLEPEVPPLHVDVSSPHCPAGYVDPVAIGDDLYRCTLDMDGGK